MELGNLQVPPDPLQRSAARTGRFAAGPFLLRAARDRSILKAAMPGVLNQSAQIMCIHGGQVTIIPKPNPIFAGPMPVLFATDLIGCPVLGCPVPPSPGSGPCLTVAAPPVNWVNPLVMATGMPVLSFMPGVPGGMTAGPTPGPLMCVSPGQTLVV